MEAAPLPLTSSLRTETCRATFRRAALKPCASATSKDSETVLPMPHGTQNSHRAERPAGSASKRTRHRASTSRTYPSRCTQHRVRVQTLSRSDGQFASGFAARKASYWLAIPPHPVRICAAAPAPFERTVRMKGARRTSAPDKAVCTRAASAGGGIASLDDTCFAPSGPYTLSFSAKTRHPVPSPS